MFAMKLSKAYIKDLKLLSEEEMNLMMHEISNITQE